MPAPALPDLDVSRRSPRGQAQVALASLDAGEQLVVQALRAARSGSRGRSLTREPQRAAAPAVAAALERYACHLLPDDEDIVATAGGGDTGYVTAIEAQTLQAIACMQAGLLGEAWKVLADICSPGRAGDALIALEEVAARVPAGPSSLA
jgi:hypothetical protein